MPCGATLRGVSEIPWFNVDDGFYDHPKVDDLPLAAVGLWTLAGAYCMRQLTDGGITESRVRKFGGTDDAIAALVDADLWERTDAGYQFKDWGDWQLTRGQIESKREKDRERKQRQRRDYDGTYTATPPATPPVNPQRVPVGHREDSQSDSEGSHTVQSNPIQSLSPTEREGPRKRAHALPDDWAPTDAHRALATERGVDCDLEADKMRDWAAGTGATGKDWDARFRNWLRNAKPDPRQHPQVDRQAQIILGDRQRRLARNQPGEDPWQIEA